MSEKRNKVVHDEEQPVVGLSRRQFLKDAGLVVGGATVGSMAILSACGGGETVTKTSTKTVTTTVGSGSTVTTTITAGGTTVTKFVCPFDNQEFSSIDALKSHFMSTHPGATLEGLTQFSVNGKSYWRAVQDNWTLAYVLREKLGLTGTKRGCDTGDCGVCTVNINGRPALSCLMLAVEASGLPITTVEGLAREDQLDPLQQAFVENDALQCGFCTPGQIMTARALLAFKSNPTSDEINEFMAGTLCRCGVHPNVVKAIQAVAQ